VLPVCHVDEPQVFVKEAAVAFDARLEVGDAHVLGVLILYALYERLFDKGGDLHRQLAEPLELLRRGRLMELCPGRVGRRGKVIQLGEQGRLNAKKGDRGIAALRLPARRRRSSSTFSLRCARRSERSATSRFSCCQAAKLSGVRAKTDMRGENVCALAERRERQAVIYSQ